MYQKPHFPKPTALFSWIDNSPLLEVQACLFRKTLEWNEEQPEFEIIVSADNRYLFWINGTLIGRGPLKGTPSHYHAETYNIAPYLKKGLNILAAEVRWYGEHGPLSEVHTANAGFFVQGVYHDTIDTPGDWLAFSDPSLSANTEDPFNAAKGWLGSTDRIDSRLQPKNWQSLDFDDTSWTQAVGIGQPPTKNEYGLAPTRDLTPRTMPHLIERRRNFSTVLENRIPIKFPWTLEADQGGEIWLDVGSLTTGYPEIELEGGANREIHIIYAESLGKWIDGNWEKGRPRNDIHSLEPHGYRDTLILSEKRFTFKPFHWRTFWYIKIKILPGQTPVTINNASFDFTTFPQSYSARFTCDGPEIKKLWQISLRTLQLCAHETYEDCPYFEQLSYVADTRLQALSSYYLANESRLGKHCIQLYKNSLSSNGMIASREPSSQRQEIPAFAIHWIFMIGDYWDLKGSAEIDFIKSNLASIHSVLCYFKERINEEGFVGAIDEWAWTDWVKEWDYGVSPAVRAGTGSTYMTALFAMGLETAIRLFEATTFPQEVEPWRRLRKTLIQTIQKKAWSHEKGYFIEGPGRESDNLAQQTQTMAILAGAASPSQKEALRKKLFDDPQLVKSSLFHRFYLAQAADAIGCYDRLFSSILSPWYQLINDGFTTWPENERETRSDCHAWSSWMVIDFLRNILGARPAKAGWNAIEITPRYSATRSASGSLPTPVGEISIKWSRNEQQETHFEATTPSHIPTRITLSDGTVREYEFGGHFVFNTANHPPV